MVTPKTFLLVMPDYSDFSELFMKNLEKSGFQASLITDKIPVFKYKGNQRLLNFFRKTFLKDKNFKKELVANFKQNEFLKLADDLKQNFDYVLVIRPDEFPIPFIEKFRNKTSKLIAYQWDGIEKFPEVKNYFSLFDSFFCFEEVKDVENVKKITNFYFDFDDFKSTQPIQKNMRPVFYFVGLDWENRRKKIDNFVQFAVENNISLNFYLQEFDKNENKNPNITYIKKRISFAENLEFVKKADVLLDFVDPRHDGLSIRFFEGMYYKKKVITDNKMVRNYEFYHPSNILVLENNYQDIDEFLKIPYYEISDKIVKKYGFSSWIKKIIKE
ncbi:hypothetical protein QGN23_12465 [Chryseobacterium gotjawalense]|uniref:Lipopolysaccharide biosynthesis protein n=1 Tax=Chryseobacterium gotjawalense TaxID=3042315 RepID=A0ABY8RB96_9FLAO|nr:hypothetical protein [Chryseobacterium sp. wdc7]WHF51236.1 hypothetical protein QGN23_12465 [Chryseobacterium sp. wdc7]